MSTTIMQSLTFTILIVSKEIAMIKFSPHAENWFIGRFLHSLTFFMWVKIFLPFWDLDKFSSLFHTFPQLEEDLQNFKTFPDFLKSVGTWLLWGGWKHVLQHTLCHFFQRVKDPQMMSNVCGQNDVSHQIQNLLVLLTQAATETRTYWSYHIHLLSKTFKWNHICNGCFVPEIEIQDALNFELLSASILHSVGPRLDPG